MHRLWGLPGFRHIRRSGRLNAMLGRCYGSHWGTFPDRQAALGYLRRGEQVVYDDDRLADINVELFSRIQLFDWPVVFHLQSLANEGALHRVTDFGGHVGVKYRAYRQVMAFAEDLVWQVVDVPAICRAGRRSAVDLPQLRFHEEAETTEPSDVLLCSGSLQYVEDALDVIVARLPARPRVIILNKVSVTDGQDFHTLEDFGVGRMPHQVLSRASLGDLRQRCGYALQRSWDIPDRAFEVLSGDGVQTVRMVGEVWRDAERASSPDRAQAPNRDQS